MERFSVIPAEAGIYFYHTDGLGSVTELTDNSGAVVQSYLYDSFGNVSTYDATGTQVPNDQGPVKNAFTYTGREIDTESGLYYYRARYYNPRVGRFLQEDHSSGDDSDPSQKYSYVSNSPTNLVDPSGDFAISVTVGLGLGLLAIALAGLMLGPVSGRMMRDLANRFPRNIPDGAMCHLNKNPYPLNPDDWVPPDGVEEDVRAKEATNGKHRQWKDATGRTVRRWDRGVPGAPGWRGRDHWHDEAGRHIAPK